MTVSCSTSTKVRRAAEFTATKDELNALQEQIDDLETQITKLTEVMDSLKTLILDMLAEEE